MTEYAGQRALMVAGQLAANGVRHDALLEAFGKIPRENFVPLPLRNLAYVDEDVEIAPGRYLMEPSLFARLVQATAAARGDRALVVGCGGGYGAAILRCLGLEVTALDCDEAFIARARVNLECCGVSGVTLCCGPLACGWPARAPYDVIVMEGGAGVVPDALPAQLAAGGRLCGVLTRGRRGGGRAFLELENSPGTRRFLFDAASPLLPGLATKAAFVFA